MTSRFTELCVDGHDTRALAAFWCQVLGYRVIDENEGFVAIGTEEPSAEEVVRGPVPPMIVFAPVPEDKAVKNRLHIDVSPIDREPAEEVERLLALGATLADVGQGPDVTWTVMADPEGNEFCVLRRMESPDSP
jgi:catechol 2,3-dioxygenase-like lactoylglutathione lyase family enzyme